MISQERVADWARFVLGPESAVDVVERALRFLEEAVELAQACGVSREVAHRLIDYVYNRPTGYPEQEIGGVRVTLATLASAVGVDQEAAFEAEFTRINTPEVIEKIRQRQAEKRAALVGR